MLSQPGIMNITGLVPPVIRTAANRLGVKASELSGG